MRKLAARKMQKPKPKKQSNFLKVIKVVVHPGSCFIPRMGAAPDEGFNRRAHRYLFGDLLAKQANYQPA